MAKRSWWPGAESDRSNIGCCFHYAWRGTYELRILKQCNITVTWCHSSGIDKAFFGTVCCLLTLVHIFATCNYTCGWPFAQFLCVQSTVEETFGGGSVDWTWWAFCISVLSLFLKTLWSGRPAQNAGSTDQLSKCLHDCNSPYPNGIHVLNLQ